MRRLKKLFKIGKETALDLYSYLLFGFPSAPNDGINPCRFCGSKDVELISPVSSFESPFVLCNGCFCRGPISLPGTASAIECWNNGTTPFTKPYWARKD